MSRPASKAFLKALEKSARLKASLESDVGWVSEIAVRTLEDQSATFFRGNAVLKMGTAERRKLIKFTADIIASQVAERIRARENK